MKTEFITLPVSGIQIDERNPRFPAVENQKEAIDSMLNDQGDKLYNLALDICEYGLDPSKRLIIFREKGFLVDGDGNRRITALKILETPALAEAYPTIRKKFESLRRTYKNYPTEINCVILPSREAAKHWIEINHGGALEGRGQTEWTSEQKARFQGALSIGLAAMDTLVRQGLITEADKAKVKKTNLDRILNYKSTKSALNIETFSDTYIFGDIERLHQLFFAMQGLKVEAIYRAENAERFLIDALGDLTPRSEGAKKAASASRNAGQKETKTEITTRTRRSKAAALEVFGGALALRLGDVNNLYRDIESIYRFYQQNKPLLSPHFIALFRMSLRLLAETAAKDCRIPLQDYVKSNFDAAKAMLDTDSKTTLSAQNVKKETIVQLFQTGAHDYSSGKNEAQAIAMSIALGAMVKISHPKK